MESQRSERGALARDHSDLLVELSVALHRHSMYPSGHPSIEPALEAVVRRAERLLQERASITIGVTRRQLLVEDAATDPGHPVLRRLAEALHDHHIGAVSITRGVHAVELSEALRWLAGDADTGGPSGLKPEAPASWPHLKLHPLAFDNLALADNASPAEDLPGQDSSRAAALWAGLARAAVGRDEASPTDLERVEPLDIAEAIDSHPPSEMYDRAVLRGLMQIAHELATGPVEEGGDLRERTASLVSSLRTDTLRRLVNVAGDGGERGRLLHDAAHGMAVGAVLEIVKAAADADRQTISHGLLRMLAKLALYAGHGSELGRPRGELEFREQILRLLDEWQLEDPNPGAYGRVLERLSSSTPRIDGQVDAGPADERSESLRIVQMSLESNAFGPLTEKAIQHVVQSGHLTVLLELLVSPPSGAGEVRDAILSRLTSPDTLKALLNQERVDLAALDALLPRLPVASYGPLLDAIGSSPNRAVRRRLLDRLAQTVVDISPLVIARLDDERWYVQRNMLMLLTRTPRLPEGFSALRWTSHPDARVRAEAIRLQLALPREKAAALRTALGDYDARIVRLGLAAVQQECPVDLMGRVAEIAVAPEVGPESRLMAVTALGRVQDASVLEVLLRLADGGRSLLGRPRLPPRTPVLLAVLRVLSETWASDPRAARVLAVAARSADPEFRRVAAPPMS